jgi:uncharacterized membrane protein
MMLVFFGLWALLPRIDPVAPSFKGFRYAYDFFFFSLFSFLAYVYALSLGINLGWQFNMLTMILPALALLIFIIGAIMPRLKRNWFVGIRTPWTISSDLVWEKTHKIGGVIFEIAALFILIGTWLPRTLALWFILLPLLVAALVPVIYSYFIFKTVK